LLVTEQARQNQTWEEENQLQHANGILDGDGHGCCAFGAVSGSWIEMQ
jgi:hypothetical protein